MMMTDQPVLIVGAGPTGLALALWLTRLGVRVRIVDKTAEPGTTSRAVAVQARTLELYRQIDLSGAVVEAGVKVAAANLWVGGAKATRVPLGRMGEGLSAFPYALTYPQDAHERLLIERLDALGVKVERRTELVRFDQRPERVRALLKRPDGSEEICEAAYLAGCDGAHSTVREALATGFPGGTYSGVFYVADVDAAGPAANGEIHVDLEEADFLAVFPLTNTGRLRLIGPLSFAPDHEPERIAFARRLVATTDRVFTVVTKPGVVARWVRTRLVPLIAAPMFRLGSVRRFLFGTVSQIGVNYRDSPLSVGAAGAVRGGDRLPWVELGSGLDNFAPLTSLTWQVHVYGEPRRGVAEVCAELRLPFHIFAWKHGMRRAGLQRAALYLVRPDGYVALADPHADPERLRRYFDERGDVGQRAVQARHAA
jgi:NAD(P)-dependent dehydrogenase (short-subunit alcohol dehydrogenase family)